MTSYSTDQITFCLNSIANGPSGQFGDPAKLEEKAKERLIQIFSNPDIIQLIGKWKLVWGPKVYEHKNKINAPSFVADNAMYVAQSLSPDTTNHFVVAISGTNPISPYGWFHEDFAIYPPKPWPYGDPTEEAKGNITNGTSVGLEALLGLEDNGLTFVKYLANQVSNPPSKENPVSVTVTGHSLGGALSPAVALMLSDSQGVSLDESHGWDVEGHCTISVMPTAGPTAGDEKWRNYYDGRLGDNTTRGWNKFDIVPHAWQISPDPSPDVSAMLNQIPTIYEPTIVLPRTSELRKLVNDAIELSKKFERASGSPLKQICPSTKPLEGGDVDPSITNFMKQAGYQHTTAYSKLMKITDFIAIVNGIDKKLEKTDKKCCNFFCF